MTDHSPVPSWTAPACSLGWGDRPVRKVARKPVREPCRRTPRASQRPSKAVSREGGGGLPYHCRPCTSFSRPAMRRVIAPSQAAASEPHRRADGASRQKCVPSRCSVYSRCVAPIHSRPSLSARSSTIIHAGLYLSFPSPPLPPSSSTATLNLGFLTVSPLPPKLVYPSSYI